VDRDRARPVAPAGRRPPAAAIPPRARAWAPRTPPSRAVTVPGRFGGHSGLRIRGTRRAPVPPAARRIRIVHDNR